MTTAPHSPIERPLPFLNAENRKLFSHIPLLGWIPYVIEELAITKEYNTTPSRPRLIELIDTKNEFKSANIVSNLLATALIALGVASGILSITFGVCLATLFIGVTAFNASAITSNKNTKTKYQQQQGQQVDVLFNIF